MPADVVYTLNSGLPMNRGAALIAISPVRGVSQTRDPAINGPFATIEQFRAKLDNRLDKIRFYTSYSGV